MTQTNQYTIRRVRGGDAQAVIDIATECFPQDDAAKIAIPLMDNDHFYVAEDLATKQVLGLIAFGVHSIRAAHIMILAVRIAYQRAGIGSSLLRYALKIISLQHVARVRLEVRTTNKEAITFYEKHGFVIAGKIESYYDDNSDAYLMIYEIKRR